MIRLFPVREGILKRNQLHSNVATAIAFLNGMQAFFMMTILFVIVSISEPFEGKGQLWWAFGIPFVQSIVLIVLAIYATRKLRGFERKYFSSAVDETQLYGKTIKKWRFGWTTEPDLLEKWLCAMALEGYHLVRIRGARFTFTKGERKHVSYVYDYQFKASPNYYDIHKEAGWQLKFTSPYAIIKPSLWMKEYESGGDRPLLTYELPERKVLVRNVLLSNLGLTIFLVVITWYVLWLNFSLHEEGGWNLWGRFIVSALGVSIIHSLYSTIRSFKYAIRMR